MRAWMVARPGPLDTRPLRFVERVPPAPGPREVAVGIDVCAVCRTDLHLVEGDLAPRRPGVVPGHQAVGLVEELGEGVERFSVGERVGIAWLRWSCGRCTYCARGDENLCTEPRFTGWDDDGGFAERAVVHEDYAYPLPDAIDDEHIAPLLCAGIIGFRALRRSRLQPGGRLGIYGFGASAHIAAQVAIFEGAAVHVVTRSRRAQKLARALGAASAGAAGESPPEPLDAAIVFAPSGEVVPLALKSLRAGGTVAVAGIHMSDIPALRYDEHLFHERSLTSVTANTRADGRELLDIAGRIPVQVTTTPFELSEADAALGALEAGGVEGAAVLRIAR
ncbi:MAG: zinc-dependent alcohol dehydrogenase family protein [Actinomycetota bacterium]